MHHEVETCAEILSTVVLNVLMPNVFKFLKYKCSPFLSKGYKRYKLF